MLWEKFFPLMTRKHGLVILKKRSTSSFHTNNVSQAWSRAKVFYEQNREESLRPASHLQRNPGSHSPGKEMPYLPLGSGDRDSLLSSSTLLDQTSCLAQQGSHVSRVTLAPAVRDTSACQLFLQKMDFQGICSGQECLYVTETRRSSGFGFIVFCGRDAFV